VDLADLGEPARRFAIAIAREPEHAALLRDHASQRQRAADRGGLARGRRTDLERRERLIRLVELAEIERREAGRLRAQAGERPTGARDLPRVFVTRPRDEQARVRAGDVGAIRLRAKQLRERALGGIEIAGALTRAGDRELRLDRIGTVARGCPRELDRFLVSTEAQRGARRDHPGARGSGGRRSARRCDDARRIDRRGPGARDRDRMCRCRGAHAQRERLRAIGAAVGE